MPSAYRFANSEVRPDERSLLIDGAPATLGARAFDVLMTLIERRDRVVTKDELFEIVWPGLVVEENNLQVHVSSLRKLLGSQAIATIPGRGYRFVAPLTAAEDARTPRADTVPPTPNNLPQMRTRFIGREKALDDCAGLLDGTRLLTLSGIGGCGKTRLAQELAQRRLTAFPDGVWFVDLGPLQEARRVSATVAATLGVKNAADDALDRISSHLEARRALIVLDNCEHVIDAAVESIDAILQAGDDVKVLATSREALGMSGEQIFAVRSLSLPATDDPADIARSEAVRLFVDHARLVLPDFAVDARNASAIADICRRLDGIALAIELAAARVRVLTLDDIRARLSDRFRLLTGGQRAMPRHQTLQATMQWSHDLLTPREQRLFRRLAVFAGGCTLDAAFDVTADGGDEYDTLERLTALHDKSLVFVDRDTQTQPRYRMLETVRQYAEERLNEAGEGDDVRDRHLVHYVTLAERAEPELLGAGQAAWYALLAREQENIMAAHAWCGQAQQGGELALRLCAALARYWYATTQHLTGRRLATEALAIAPDGADPLLRAKALDGLAYFCLRLGRYDEGLAHVTGAIAAARDAGDMGLAAAAMVLAGALKHGAGLHEEALAQFERGYEAAASARHPKAISSAINGLAEAHRVRGDLALACELYERAIKLDRERGDLRALMMTLSNLTCARIDLGDMAAARAAFDESVAVMGTLGSAGPMCCTLDIAAALAEAAGDHVHALRFHGAGCTRLAATGMQLEPVDRSFVQRWADKARASLPADAAAAIEAEGRALEYESALTEIGQWMVSARQAAPARAD
ncbi:MAG TPA: winged helix-turn-helix domain-containing protein [Casimicrobiaceae bacterium]|jgi:predicted ATPase/DNA-binding winged helix-turn-helix (wHTH) protein